MSWNRVYMCMHADFYITLMIYLTHDMLTDLESASPELLSGVSLRDLMPR